MNKLILVFIFLIPLLSNAQECNCVDNFNWAKKTFEENDAGFQFAIDNKGQDTYEQHNKQIEEKIANIDNLNECAQTIYEWMTFFRSGHISIQTINQPQQNENQKSDQDIINSFKDWEKIDIDEKKFRNNLMTTDKDNYEGIWVSEPYTIGIKKVGSEYLGFIIEADGVYWTKGQIKLRIQEDSSSTYYMRDHSAQHFTSTQLLGNSYLEMGFITLKRTFPEVDPEAHIERYFTAISAQNPYVEEINDNTMLIRIPSFSGSEKSKIDRVIKANKEKILKTQNLIIDLRNNGGGSDNSYEELLPFLYTNTIRTVGVEMLSTPLNNQRMLDFINNDDFGFDKEGKKWAQKSYDKLSKHIGEFVMLNEHPITEETFDTVHEFPKNVGIIINENNGSTTEQFLLAAKQSKKVKLFGTTTTGVLDISNMYFVPSPCEEFNLGYCLSKSMRIPHMTIDDKGIQPDYYINNQIPKYKWVDFVTDILNE